MHYHLNTHLYQEINKIIVVLKNANEPVFAKSLEDALSISTIPSEILGELRIALLNLNKSNSLEVLKIQTTVSDALTYIDKIT